MYVPNMWTQDGARPGRIAIVKSQVSRTPQMFCRSPLIGLPWLGVRNALSVPEGGAGSQGKGARFANVVTEEEACVFQCRPGVSLR